MVMVLLAVTITSLLPFYPVASAVTFSGPIAVEQYPGFDLLPTALRASDGVLWLAWQSDRFGAGNYTIFYKTQTFGTWSATSNITSPGTTNPAVLVVNVAPALAQLKNGTVTLFFASNQTRNYNLYYQRWNPFWGWSKDVKATSGNFNDTTPTATVGSDGTLWLVWTRITITCAPICIENRQLFYKTLRNGVWSQEAAVPTTGSSLNSSPSTIVSKDGRVWVVWSKGPGQQEHLYYKTFDGTLWTSDTALPTSGTDPDIHPSIVQDRNGTLWTFWERRTFVSPTLGSQSIIYNKNSIDNGATWSTDSRMTNSIAAIDDRMPVAVQAADKTVWVFYVSNPNRGDPDIYAMQSSLISPVHDVTISSIKTSNNKQYPGGLSSVKQSPIVNLTVTVSNLGDFAETVSVTLTVSNVTSYSFTASNVPVPIGKSTDVLFKWNTANVKPARYSVTATVPPVTGETLGNRGDNTLRVSYLVWILPLGDVDQDGNVNQIDAGVFAYGFGFFVGSPRYNPYADIRGNGTIDIIDVGVMAINFGIVT